MAGRPTLKDVAREANVSIATVNRVVAGSENVRVETARKVAEAAGRIGYHAHSLIVRNLGAGLPVLRLGVVLHKERQAFYQAFAQHLARAAAQCRNAQVRLDIEFCTSQGPRDAADQLRRMVGRADVVAATAVNHHVVTDAVADLREAEVPCFSLLSDFAQGVRNSYFGLNNMRVGRGAAKMLATTCRNPGKIGLFVGGNRWHGHELREMGFRLQFRETSRPFEVLDTLVNLETRQLTYEATLDLLSRHKDLVGLYLAGGGMEGAIAALREETEPGQVVLVVNENTPDSIAAMADGYVQLIVGTPLERLCERLVAAAAELVRSKGAAPGGQVFFDPELVLPEFF